MGSVPPQVVPVLNPVLFLPFLDYGKVVQESLEAAQGGNALKCKSSTLCRH